MSNCEICGAPMPTGEEMFKYHGYSGPCPKPPLMMKPRKNANAIEVAYGLLWGTTTDDKRVHEARRLLLDAIGKDGQVRGIEGAKKLTPNS